jgi:hypothetical protein
MAARSDILQIFGLMLDGERSGLTSGPLQVNGQPLGYYLQATEAGALAAELDAWIVRARQAGLPFPSGIETLARDLQTVPMPGDRISAIPGGRGDAAEAAEGLGSGTYAGPDFIYFCDESRWRRCVPVVLIKGFFEHEEPDDDPMTIVSLDDGDRILLDEPLAKVLDRLRRTAPARISAPSAMPVPDQKDDFIVAGDFSDDDQSAD